MDFDANIILSGETGVGKSMYAKKIHSGSSRKALPFIEINCAAIPENLLESELFGYERGAFTGADSKGKKGQIELAQGGTLFLDEISELSMKLQSKLLKVIQDRRITRIGGTSEIEVGFRLIAASNKDLEQQASKGLFRQDLFFRLNVIPIKIPALRDRKEDIHPLAKQFLDEFNRKYNAHKYFGKDAVDCMERYGWPGNVRELQNTIERLVLTSEYNRISAVDMPFCGERTVPPETVSENRHGEPDILSGDGMHDVLNRIEEEMLRGAYKDSRGNISEMSRRLHLTRQSVIRRMAKYKISEQGDI